MSSLHETYDYIVCGGGSAGCVVASRLSEEPTCSVLLLEAGPSDLDWPDTHIPGMCASLQRTDIDWDYKCEPQANSYRAFEDVTWTRAKVLGGCSSHNYMVFTRCSSADYNSWAKMGCDGWSWDEVLPYFLKSENGICHSFANSPYHNIGGPVTVSSPHRPTAVSSAFVQAGMELGFNRVDVMSGDIIGFGDFPANIDKDGKRSNTSRAYIHPVMDRSNLTVQCNAHVTKIDIKNKKAVGVQFRTKDGDKYVAVNKEVIVSGGTVNSPQLLMLSGIGPKRHLQEFGIDCVADLPVGQNLQDHLAIQMKVSVKPDSQVYTLENVPLDTNGEEATAFFKSGLEIPEVASPDCQFHFTSVYHAFGPNEAYILGITDPKYHPIMSYDVTREEMMTRKGFTIDPVLLHPKSRGEIKLRSTDPLQPPSIDPHYLEDPYDVIAMIQGIRLAKKVIESKAMSLFGCKLNNLTMPGSDHGEWSDENLESFVRHYAFTLYHPTGTCKMGAQDDPTAVVDPQLRVIGVEGLRVIDASIMPNVTSGNTNAPSIMIGEKGADMLINGSYKWKISSLL